MSSHRFFIRIIAVLLTTLTFLGCFSSCAQSDEGEAAQTQLTYSAEDISSCVSLDAYTDLEIELESEDASKSEAVWTQILARATVTSYPEAQVEYYAEQTRAKYRYYAKQNNMEYERVLEIVGLTDADIVSEAKAMVKGDLVYRYIVEDAAISLSEDERTGLYDKYVDKYVSDYGYNRAYVTSYLSEHVYESMLYDKTMEYLVLNNTFVVGGETQNG